MNQTTSPVVMCFSGLDATGGAGIQADIEAITSMGAHPAPIVTAHTVQDTQQVYRYETQDALLIIEQARAVLEDIPVAAFKLGMLGDVAIIESIHSILADYPTTPVVFDPVLASGQGDELADAATIDAMRELLFPQTTILTPNSIEAKRLAPEADTLDACAEALQNRGCEFILITGTHEQGNEVVNSLYNNHRIMERFHWTRLPHEYHGSGCTLAASIAGLLAHGLEPFTAINEAQDFTWQSLAQAKQLGKGQHIPQRFFWTMDDDE